jgi:hypothetical protein
MTYHLRRLRLHGIIERLPRSHRYRVFTIAIRPICSGHIGHGVSNRSAGRRPTMTTPLMIAAAFG